MFSTLGLFRNLPCPHRETCTRRNCLYSHAETTPDPRPLILVQIKAPVASTSRAITQVKPPEIVPAKRPAISPVKTSFPEPPRKVQKVGLTQGAAVPSLSTEVSRIKPFTCVHQLNTYEHLVWRSYFESKCCPISCPTPSQTSPFGEYIAFLSFSNPDFYRQCSRLFMIISPFYTIRYCHQIPPWQQIMH